MNDENAFVIDYDDEYGEMPAEEKKKHYLRGDNAIKPLIPVTVDPGYELEKVLPRELDVLYKLRIRFEKRKDEAIPFNDLRMAMYKIGEDDGKPMSLFTITHTLRDLWRYGELQRFIRGKSKRSRKVGRGEFYGVHYILYPGE